MAAEADNEGDREIVVSRVIDGPRRLVFDAFTTATHLAEWCAPTGGKITTHAFDFKPGGVWDATIQGPDGSEYPNHFEWKEIAPPERIVWMYGMGKDDPHPVKTILTLVERGTTTEAILRLVFGTKEERDEKVAKYYAAQGAQRSLDALAAHVAGGR
ncbi:MAG: SRPBCC domain-containing protein [Chloroflexota bacterium]|nr:SRPBCC domain-containing protein [Chloroflexota bacterium]